MTDGLGQLTDAHGRAIKDLRVSVTDRCNLRCSYCMPADGMPWFDREELLTYEEIRRIVRVFASIGVSDVRLTGGEPLVRRDLPVLVAMLSMVRGVRDIALTTNGVLLAEYAEELAAAGLDRINVSLDSLDPERFLALTRRPNINRVMAGLAAVERLPALWPVKINVVALRGFTEVDVLGFAELARTSPFVVRFIEFMPLDADQRWQADDVLSGAEIRALVTEHYPLTEVATEASSTARRFAFADGHGELGFVSPVSEPFCAGCDRVRLTCDGKLRTCLFSLGETDLRELMRNGCCDEDLVAVIRAAVWRKELKHRIGDQAFVAPARGMSQIGG